MEATFTKRQGSRAWRVMAGIGLAGSLVGLLATPAAADGGSGSLNFFSEYSDATWQTTYDAGGRSYIRAASATVRVSGGEEKPAAQKTTLKFDASVKASVCIEGGSNDSLVTFEGSSSQSGTNLGGINIKSWGGDADVVRSARLVGTITYVPAGQNCASPQPGRSWPVSLDAKFTAEWDNRSGSVPVEYSGDDCGGTGQCYYRDATASGTLSLGNGWPSFNLGRTSSPQTWMWEGVYPPAV